MKILVTRLIVRNKNSVPHKNNFMDVCQHKKNIDLKKSSLFLTPFGVSKKESINIGILVNTELISTNLSP
jgi:hypothetical protein